MSAVAEEMLGYTEEERKLPITARLPSRMRLLRPDASPYSLEEYPPIRALRGEIARGEEMIMRTPGRARDLRVLASAGPIRARDGTLLGAVTILTDISDLHEVRTQLEEANARLTAQASELREAAQRLDERVQERTAELAEREASLREAIAQKERALQDLQEAMHELQASRKQLHHLAHRLVEVQEQERSYVADHLYNQAGQMLAALKLQMTLLERRGDGSPSLASLVEMQTVLDQTLRDLHELAAQLHPVGLDHPTGVGLLCDFAVRFCRSHGLSAQVYAAEADSLELAPQTITAVYRSLEEALSNVVRHARATEATLTIRCAGDFVRVALWDNGIGFDPASTYRERGVGLIGVRERMQSIGGQLTVESGPGGTTLVLLAPLNCRNGHAEEPG
jgi:signal transduction histidine kinase